jgi:hypothetical protein
MNAIPTKAFWVIWTVISLLLFATLPTNLEITNGIIKKGFVYIFIFGLIKILTKKTAWTFARSFIVSTAAFGLFLIFTLYTEWQGDWKTQTITRIEGWLNVNNNVSKLCRLETLPGSTIG